MGHRCGGRRRTRLASWAVIVVAAGAVLGSGGICLTGHADATDVGHAHGHPIVLEDTGGDGHTTASPPCSTSACASSAVVTASAAVGGAGASWMLGGSTSTWFGEAAARPEPPVPRTLRRS